MEDRAVRGIQTVIRYIESRLGGRLELETVAEAVHYSKYHLHRMFTETVGMTLHDYVQRRRLTEAAKLLAFSRRPISQIALQCGYESQQSFSQAFKSMYKAPPAAYRAAGNFYPLQLPFTLRMERGREAFRKEEIRLAEERDIPAWMELMRLVIDGYPAMDEGAYLSSCGRAFAPDTPWSWGRVTPWRGLWPSPRGRDASSFWGCTPSTGGGGSSGCFWTY